MKTTLQELEAHFDAKLKTITRLRTEVRGGDLAARYEKWMEIAGEVDDLSLVTAPLVEAAGGVR